MVQDLLEQERAVRRWLAIDSWRERQCCHWWRDGRGCAECGREIEEWEGEEKGQQCWELRGVKDHSVGLSDALEFWRVMVEVEVQFLLGEREREIDRWCLRKRRETRREVNIIYPPLPSFV